MTDGEAQPNDLLRLEREADFGRHAYEAGWTDGLPVVDPTPDRVEAMMLHVDMAPLEILGIMPPGQGIATVHAVAANAVMAGCDPAHFPVVVACVRALLDRRLNLYGIQTTTSPVTPVVMVNGPVVERLGFNGGHNCFGPGNRSNAVIGRTVRFCLLNVGHARPGTTDMATLGQPGKYGFCFAENEAANPWEPHHVERGFSPDRSCVTVFQGGMVSNILDFGSKTAESLLLTMSNLMSAITTNNMQLGDGDLLLVLCPEHAAILAREGLTKDDIKRFLHQNARTPARRFSPGVLSCIRDWRSARYKLIGPDTMLPVVDDPQHVNIAVAGGDAGGQSAFIAGFGDGWSVCTAVPGQHATEGKDVNRSAADISHALAGIRDALERDGYGLEVTDTADVLSVRICALEGACEDCLVPPDAMALTISGALHGSYAPEQIDIAYPDGSGG